MLSPAFGARLGIWEVGFGLGSYEVSAAVMMDRQQLLVAIPGLALGLEQSRALTAAGMAAAHLQHIWITSESFGMAEAHLDHS